MNVVVKPERGFLHKTSRTVAALVILLSRADHVDRLEVVDELAPLGKLGGALAAVVLEVALPVQLEREDCDKGEVALVAPVLGLLGALGRAYFVVLRRFFGGIFGWAGGHLGDGCWHSRFLGGDEEALLLTKRLVILRGVKLLK